MTNKPIVASTNQVLPSIFSAAVRISDLNVY
jgi:hypothetical protein